MRLGIEKQYYNERKTVRCVPSESYLTSYQKENIGLIEVMGLAVLPARLADELTLLKDAMLSGKEIATDDKIASHAIWASEILKNILILTLIMQWRLFVMKSAEFLNRYLKMPEYLREINKEKKHLQDL